MGEPVFALSAEVEDVTDSTINAEELLSDGLEGPDESLRSHPGGLERSNDAGDMYKSVMGGSKVSTLGSNAKFLETSEAFEYETNYGIYSFSRRSPDRMSLMNFDREVLVDESRFLVRSDVLLRTAYPRIGQANDRLISVDVEVLSLGGNIEGILTTTTDFVEEGPPKISARFAPAAKSQLPNFFIEWHILTDNSIVSSQDVLFGDLSTNSEVEFVDLPTRWVRLSPSHNMDNPNRNVHLDWRDFPAGSFYAGRAGNTGQFEATVIFPENSAEIDPSIVVGSVPPGATGHSTERRTFFAAGYYWVFYEDGGDIFYRISHDGGNLQWSRAFAVDQGPTVTDFSITVDDLDVVICFTFLWQGLDWFIASKKGNILPTGGINWYASASTILTETDFDSIVNGCSVASATDGTDYVAIGAKYVVGGEDEYRVRVWRTVNDGYHFEEDDLSHFMPFPSPLSIVLTALRDGRVALVFAYDSDPRLNWAIRYLDHWDGIYACGQVDMPTPRSKNDMFSVVAGYDESLHAAFIRDTEDGSNEPYMIGHARLQGNSPCSVTNIWPNQFEFPEHPSISIDGYGFLHVFFREKFTDGGQTGYEIYYSRTLPRPEWSAWQWDGLHTPFGESSNPQSFISAPESLSSRAYAIWTEVDGAYHDIVFGSFPVLTQVSSFPGEPWRAEGMSPYQQFFSNFGHQVSPGNGQLVVHQTDLGLPGLGLDLSISRLYSVTQAYEGLIDKEYCPYPFTYPHGMSADRMWKLDFPCVGEKFLHLSGGQRYALKWDGDVFENHLGAHFKLVRNPSPPIVYTLYTKNGMEYRFEEGQGEIGKITSIKDLTGQNELAFEYIWDNGVPRQLTKIIDTYGREVLFSYQSSYPNQIERITYGGRFVDYGYDSQDRLATVSDMLSRTVTYSYMSTDPQSPYFGLISSVTFPTGARIEYDYESDNMGTEAVVYRVISERVYDDSVLVRKNEYQYEDVDGDVLFTRVSHFDGNDLKAYTEHSFDPVLGGMSTTSFDESHEPFQSGKTWNGFDGTPRQSDVYLGGSDELNYSVYKSFDNWGNVIYQRDAMGHERYASYLNTDKQNGWFKGSFMGFNELSGMKIGDYGVFYDDFLDWDLSDWSLDTSGGQVDNFDEVFLFDSPSLRLLTTGGGSSITSASHSISEPAVFFEALIMAGETYTNHLFSLKTGTTARASVKLSDFGKLEYYDADHWDYIDYMSYESGVWYWVGIEVHVTTNRYDLWLNGDEIVTNIGMLGSASTEVDSIFFKCGDPGQEGTMWIDKVNVYKDDKLKISGLAGWKRRVVVLNQFGEDVVDSKYEGVGDWEWDWNPTSMHSATIMVYSAEGVLDYASPFKIAYPSHFVFSPPSASTHIFLEESGFLKHTIGPFADDELPPGATPYQENDIPWNQAWTESPVPPSGDFSHRSAVYGGEHHHGYYTGGVFLTNDPSDYHIQYIYIPEGMAPAEINLGFHDELLGYNYFASWGEDLSSLPSNKIHIGDIPSMRDGWMMFIAMTGELGTFDQVIRGFYYGLYGGTANWDFTAVGGHETGQIRILDLPTTSTVTLFDPDDNPIAEADAPGGTAILDLYNPVNPDDRISVFPIEGYFRVEDTSTGTLEYEGPVFDALWGGDLFRFSFPSNFYPNDVTSELHSLPTCVYEWQNGPDVPNAVLMESCQKYGNTGGENGEVVTKKTLHSGAPGGWISESFEYDTYGNIESNLNAENHETTYTYHPNTANLWTVEDDLDGEAIKWTYAFYPETWEPETVENPKTEVTEIEYDEIGRVTKVIYPQVGPLPSEVTYSYDDAANQLTIYNENNHRTRQTFDGLGRLIKEERLYPGEPPVVYSTVEYQYNWLDKVTEYKAYARGGYHTWTTEYDGLGRVVEETDPRHYSNMWEYDDLSNFVTAVDKAGRKKLWARDYAGRVTSVREYSDTLCPGTGYCETLLEYDEVGNLVKEDDARTEVQQVTTYEYDDLNRLVKTTFPDDLATTETMTYDLLGNLKTWTDRMGNMRTYDYDDLGRLETTTYPNSDYIYDFEYDNNGNVEDIFKKVLVGSTYEIESELHYTYDSQDRMTSKQIKFFGSDLYGLWNFDRMFQFEYDPADILTKLTYPDNSWVVYTPDEFDRIVDVKVNGALPVASFEFHEDDSIDTVVWGNGLQTTYEYAGVKLRHIMVGDDADPDYLEDSWYYYAYDDISTIMDSSYSRHYQYDDFGRLKQLSIGAPLSDPWYPPDIYQYAYDEVGNLLTFTENYAIDVYDIGDDNQLDSIVGPSKSISYTYYDNGDMESKFDGIDTWFYHYDYDELLTEVRLNSQTGPPIAEFFYDPSGKRVLSIESGSETLTFSGGTGTLWEESPSINSETKHVYANGLHLAKFVNIDFSISYEFYHQDHLGSVRHVTDEAGIERFSTEYLPFGIQFDEVDLEKYKYTGKPEVDLDSDDVPDLYYYGARYYDPVARRFTTPDPISGSPTQPQTLNQYAYALNNPISYNDPTGMAVNVIGAVVGGIIGGIVGYVGCGIITGGWTSNECAIAGVAGAAAGALAALTFGAISLAFEKVGLFAFGTLAQGGLAASMGAGMASGAVYGATAYIVRGGLTVATGGDFEFSARDYYTSVLTGAVGGSIGGATSFVVNRAIVKYNVWRFQKSGIGGKSADNVVAYALGKKGGQMGAHKCRSAYATIKISMKLGPDVVKGFGVTGGQDSVPDILTYGSGYVNPQGNWIEVKAGTINYNQLDGLIAKSGGEYAFYKLGGDVNVKALKKLVEKGVKYWFYWW
jgi:RHS repeat-associated protein